MESLTDLDHIVFTENDYVTFFFTDGTLEVYYVDHDDEVFHLADREYVTRKTYDEMYNKISFSEKLGWVRSHMDFTGYGDDVIMREVFVVLDEVQFWQDEAA